jgi:hypothetical protein
MSLNKVEFEKLPALLRLAQVCEWTGLDRHDVSEEVKLGRIRVFLRAARRGKSSRRLYYRVDVAKLVGM